jgi:seryl-tRNA synthetase
MLDLRRLREDPEAARAACARRGAVHVERLEAVLKADAEWRRHLARVEELRAERNRLSEQVAQRKRRGEAADDLIARVRQSGRDLDEAERAAARADAEVRSILPELPNLLAETVPSGGEADAALVRVCGEAVARAWSRPHWETGVALGILDFERASKVSGSRFVFFRGDGARLVRALAALMIDLQTARGAVELLPPDLVSPDTVFGTGQLPKFRDDMFETTDGRFLISTAEIPLTAYHRDEILDAADLPLRYVAFSPCFRSEAGAAGRDTRGLIRMHQFEKVEMVRLTRPEESMAELDRLVEDAARVLEALELPYRVVLLAAADTGFGSAITYDLEVFMPGIGTYREISSCSNLTDFQARRLGIRFRDGRERPRLVHTLNGSGLAIGRTVAALLENGLEEDGRVRLPAALVPYLGGRTHLEPVR